MDIQKAFGAHLREIRTARGLTQEDLAYLADTQTSHISRIELGQNNTTIDVAHRIANALQISLSDLFNFEMDDVKLAENGEHILKVTSYMQALPKETQDQIAQIVRTFINK